MKPIAEVLSSTITGLVAESWTFDDGDGLPSFYRPRFGSFLKVGVAQSNINVYAVVFNVVTGPRDNLHKPVALKMTREQLQAEQPQIFALLTTQIHAVTVGYDDGTLFFQRLPPQPPEVHDFVMEASAEELRRLTSELDFLRLIAGVSSVPCDELIAAAILEGYRAREQDYDFLVRSGQMLTRLFKDDYDRLTAVLRKIRPPEPSKSHRRG